MEPPLYKGQLQLAQRYCSCLRQDPLHCIQYYVYSMYSKKSPCTYVQMLCVHCMLCYFSSQPSLLTLLHHPAGTDYCQSMWDGACQSCLLPCLPRWADTRLECVPDGQQVAGCASWLHTWHIYCCPGPFIHSTSQQWVLSVFVLYVRHVLSGIDRITLWQYHGSILPIYYILL